MLELLNNVFVAHLQDLEENILFASRMDLRVTSLYQMKRSRKMTVETGCEAMICWEIDKDGTWKVSHFIEEHNHELALPEEKYLLRSARKVSKVKGRILTSMVNAGIQTIDAYSYMVEESGEVENLGFSKNIAIIILTPKK